MQVVECCMSTTELVAWAGHAIEWDLWPHTKSNGACACAKLYLCTNQTLMGFLKRRFIGVCVWVWVLWVGNGISY